MTNPNNQTNGASLEDCHTNFFALTDLCGIKWRKVVWSGDWIEGGGDVLEDPVLAGYVRCIAADILCVWRRVATPRPIDPPHGLFDQLGLPPAPPPPPTPHHPPLSLQTAKELWIFWYGEQPDLSNLISADLLASEGETGSWESGLSYECRSLLFKALHNLIERCLLSRDFMRLGKWYIQPYDSNEKILEKSGHLSFSFDFFVHGESQVCASVDVRQHPPVRTLLAKHLQQAHAALHSSPPVHVILAPYGLAGTLTGQSFRPTDPQTQRLLESWRQFYPIDKGLDNSELPPAVEVIVGGVKMKYPTTYVLITDLDESTATLFNNELNVAPTPPPRALFRGPSLAEQVWHESCISSVPSITPTSTSSTNGPASVGPSTGVAVSSGNTQANTTNSSGGGGGETHSNTSTIPSSSVAAPSGQWNFVDPIRKQTCSCSCKAGSLGGGGGVESSESGAVCSPSSVTGSPAATNSIPPPDPAMPTLSPQPPQATHHPSPATDKVMPTPTDFSAPKSPKSVSSISNQMLSPYGGDVVGSVGGGSLGKCLSAEGKGTPPVGRSNVPPATTPPPNPSISVPKRPLLATLDYEDALRQELHPSPLLYDYSTLEAWLNHPVKRFKPQPQPCSQNLPMAQLQPAQQQQVVPQLQTIFKQEPSLTSSPQLEDGCVTGPGDPYEFDDEAAMNANAAANRADNFRTTPIANIKEEDKSMVNGSITLQTQFSNETLLSNDVLAVNFNDLDQMFEHPEDPPFDAVPTPPNPEGGDGLVGLSLGSCSSAMSSRTGILRPEELSKMFPTPPSLEHIPVASPITSLLIDSEFSLTMTVGSPNHEPITDWSYVYKLPEACKFVGPSKYAPLTTLPSHSLPPVTLPPNINYKPTWATYIEKQQSNSRREQQQSGQQQSSQVQQQNSISQNSQLHQQQVGTPRSVPEPSPSPGWAGTPSHHPPSHHHHMMSRQAPPPPYSPSPYHKLDPPPSPPRPEANSLVVTVLLGDSALNIFRDHNFDSCTFCVCNAGPKVVGNIKGGDAGVYLSGMMGGNSPFMSPSPHMMPMDDEPIRCNCGFSAVVNRRLSYKAGLFIEDELEITGVLDENADRENDKLTSIVMELIRDQCLVPGSWSNAVVRAASLARPPPSPGFNILALRDATNLSSIALEQGRIASLHPICKMDVDNGCVGVGRSGVHRWCFIRARGPSCNQDIIRVMKQLQPLLQDAFQKKVGAKLWEAPTVSGPLTWRQFHRLAGRGTDDRCGPQPIPSLLVGRDKDWVSLSPYGIHLWEKLLLEPYSYSRDVAYIVVAPDNDFILHRVRHFFKELSSMYEVCKLGRHFPITKVLRDGILRVGKSASQKLANEPLDDWFQMLTENSTTNMLKLYAQVCRYHLAPHLSTMAVDKTLLEYNNDKPQPSPRTPAIHDHQDPLVKQEPAEECQSQQSCGGSTPTRGTEVTAPSSALATSSPSSLDEEDSSPPHIVVYLVEPFSVGSDDPELQKLSCIAMLRVYNTVLQNIPEPLRTNLQLQIISLESIVELGWSSEAERRVDHMRSLALSVFNQCRRFMHHPTSVKALTGFGTVATNELFLKNKAEKNKKPYKVYQPAYILAEKHKHSPVPTGPSGEESSSPGSTVGDKCCVLYVSYCLSEDQRWLLASATDDSGLLLDSISINIHIPNRSRRRKASARRQGLPKLMDFILGLMSQSVVPWRLVISRIGRIGHGELKGWSWLLSKKQLLKASKQLKEMCVQCSVLYPNDVPCILSACLVSLEPDSALRLMPDQFTPDERFSQSSAKCHLSTPTDVSATHILVFPTSATTQSSQSAFQETNLSGPELGDEELLNILPDDMPEGMNDFNDIFNWPTDGDGGPGGRSPGSPSGRNGSRSQPASPTQPGGPAQSSIHSPFSNHNTSRTGDGSEEVGTLLQQPLALGYLVSTAPTGRMPRWFWSACPHLETVYPAFLKNALHLHSTAVQQNSDELLHQQTTALICHPLDSQVTTDVLRYVLEGYNALSWLALDSNTHDRLSCLPVHMQILMQLYHMTSALT